MTMPHIQTGAVEFGNNPCYFTRVGYPCILPTLFVQIRIFGLADHFNIRWLASLFINSGCKLLPVYHLHGNQMKMYRVGIHRLIVEFPDLCAVESRVFSQVVSEAEETVIH